MIIINYRGRFGNNLFQYALGRIISEELDYWIDKYKGQYFELNPFKNANIPYGSIKTKTSENNRKFLEILEGQTIDLNSIIQNKEERVIALNDYFQDYKLYLPYLKKIKYWFALPESKFKPHIDDVMIHIRRDDFSYSNSIVSLDFYTDILNRIKFRKLFICGVGIYDEEVKNAFYKYKPLYVAQHPLEDFKLIKEFSTVIQSSSTFCWWACFLSDKLKRSYLPIPVSGYWSNESGIHLKIPDKRYYYINNVNIDKSNKKFLKGE